MWRPNTIHPNGRPEEEPETIYNFAHEHGLVRRTVRLPDRATCDGCSLPCSGVAYACTPCNYLLHKSCATLPRSLRHPEHGVHELKLEIRPPYPGGKFFCNACGREGSGFCFRCDICRFDLHVPCTTLPEQVKHPSHIHTLFLLSSIPYPTNAFSCNICRHNGWPTRWVYHCFICNFDAHLHCATDFLTATHRQTTIRTPATVEHQHMFLNELATFVKVQGGMQPHASRNYTQAYPYAAAYPSNTQAYPYAVAYPSNAQAYPYPAAYHSYAPAYPYPAAYHSYALAYPYPAAYPNYRPGVVGHRPPYGGGASGQAMNGLLKQLWLFWLFNGQGAFATISGCGSELGSMLQQLSNTVFNTAGSVLDNMDLGGFMDQVCSILFGDGGMGLASVVGMLFS